MRLYKIKFTDRTVWAGTEADMKDISGGKRHPAPNLEYARQEEVPTTKAELIDFLNALTARDEP